MAEAMPLNAKNHLRHADCACPNQLHRLPFTCKIRPQNALDVALIVNFCCHSN